MGERCGLARLPPCVGGGSYGEGGVDGDADGEPQREVDHVVLVPGAVGLRVDGPQVHARARVGRDQMYRDGLNDLTQSRVL